MAHAYLVPPSAVAAAGAQVTVAGDEARHAVRVARLRVDETVDLVDGEGTRMRCTVTEVGPDAFTARVDDVQYEPVRTPRIHLAQALAKGGRDELAVQAAVELGVDGVVPWQAQRSVSQWRGDKVAKQRARWATIAREATKQSLRATVPEVNALATTPKMVAHAVPGARLLVLDPAAEMQLTEADVSGDDVVLVVGPEGGIAPAEIAAFTELGAQRVRLGGTVLRTSTAGAAAIAVLQVRLGRW